MSDEAVKQETPVSDAPKAEQKPRSERPPQQGNRPPQGNRPQGNRPPQGGGGGRPPQGGGERRGDDRGPRPQRFGDFAPDIDLEKLISDALYLDNQAHAVVARLRDMDSGTKSQLRRFYNAVRRACRTVESERQHEFVMLRARLAYTIARHGLRSLDVLERLLLQVTRKNDQRGYERFRDLFEAIVAYNE
jgi:CRISPR type III-A-associated protein Csm2